MNKEMEGRSQQVRVRGLALLLFAILLGIGGAAWEVMSPTGPTTPLFNALSYRDVQQGNVGVPRPRTGLIATSDNPGQVLFGRYCDSCHPAGRAGIGSNLRSAQFKQEYTSADQVAEFVRKGGFDMPAFPPNWISDAELAKISQFALSLSEDSE